MTRLSTIVVLVLMLSPAIVASGAEPDPAREGGIVGTGIAGTITRLGSFVVNDQWIAFPPDMPVTGGLTISQARELHPGDTVAVIAEPRGNDWNALSIRRVIPIVGPVSKQDGNTLTVMGTVILLKGELPPDVSNGTWIAVSGLWQRDQVVASRIERIAPQERARITGSFLGYGASGRLLIGNTQITGITPRHISPGDVVTVEGRPESRTLNATSLAVGLFAGKPGLMQVEGYLSVPQPTGLYSLLGSGLIAYTDQIGMIDPLQRTVRCGLERRLIDDDPRALNVAESDILKKLGCLSK